jgi:hypothetical protein
MLDTKRDFIILQKKGGGEEEDRDICSPNSKY